MITGLRRLAQMAALTFAFALASCSGASEEPAAERTTFNIGWSIYAGWMPWPYADQSGIVAKWEEKYGIEINFVQVNDYVESVNQYTAGQLDGVTVANMDALTIPAAGGKDTSAIIVGDYSNGNDGILLKGSDSVATLKGKSINLVELSVSHYLLARALEGADLAMTDVNTVNTSDADIAGAFTSSDVTAAVAWNPQLTTMKQVDGANLIFSSADIPGEIVDLLVVDTALVKANPKLGKALAGIWYETMAVMQQDSEEGQAARAAMAKLAGATTEMFEEQLATTYLYAEPAAAVAATSDAAMVETMTRVRDFSYSQGLFGQGADADAIGMEFPGGKTLGDANNITLRFDASFMQMAADGEL
ncbi:MAG: putative urea ABC transporter substrate-binding protein [Pseudomonadota bacterium]